jgi:hypothetical protein
MVIMEGENLLRYLGSSVSVRRSIAQDTIGVVSG